MTRQSILWTTLPQPTRGQPGSQLRLSVLVSPRLEPSGEAANHRISLFPDFERWPEVVASVQFQVEFTNGPRLEAKRIGPAPRLDIWRALVKPDTWVRPYTPSDLHKRRILSYPVRHAMDFTKTLYQKVGSRYPTALPKVTELLGRDLLGPLSLYGGEPERARSFDVMPQDHDWAMLKEIEVMLTRNKAIPRGAPEPKRDLTLAWVFHRGTAYNPADKPPQVPDFDFHDIVAALAEYPALMRRLGLIIDLEVPYQADIPRNASLRVLPAWSPALANTLQSAPRTAYTLGPSGFFVAQSATPLVHSGMLQLHNLEFFTPVQVDTDGATLKLLNLTKSLDRSLHMFIKSTDSPEQASLPALRSAGIAIAQSGLAQRLVQDLEAANQMEQQAMATVGTLGGGQIILGSDEVTQGYRVDVWDESTCCWYPLCYRVGEYSLPGTNLGFRLEDEGWVSLAATSTDKGANADLHLHEAIIRWTGWSLVAPRPGRAIDPAEEVNDPEEKEAAPFKIQTRFAPVPGTLPRLRFGRAYRLRARAVDLAGNSLPFGDRDAKESDFATPEITYGRLEPVESPTLLPRTAMGPGESVERVVIRSKNRAQPAAGEAERHLLPPRVSQETAEAHGLFDQPAGLNKAAYALITARDGAIPEKELYPETQVQIPYLPDPIARGAAFRGLPGLPADESFAVDFSGTWPDRNPFRIRLVAGEGSPELNDRLLTVYLPQAEVARVKLSSRLGAEDLNLMGVWHWLTEEAEAAARMVALRLRCLDGCHWMLTPYREILLVHAVEQPLAEPVLQNGSAARRMSEITATLQGNLGVHGKSTGKVDFMASWREPVDRLDQPKWEWMEMSERAFELPIEPHEESVTLGSRHRLGEERLKHRFADTRYRKVTYQPIATSRFTEYFPPGSPERFNLAGPTTVVHVPSSERPAAPQVRYVVPTFEWDRKRSPEQAESQRKGSILRVYLDRPWFSSGEGEELAVILWDLPTTVPANGQIPAQAQPFVTDWGRDPLWHGSALFDFPKPEHFPLAGQAHRGLTLPKTAGFKVVAMPHQVGYDERRQLWYCDIEIQNGLAYYSFVRLALARYQANSIPEAHLSPVVLADYAQLAPNRGVTLTFNPSDPQRLNISATGITPVETGTPLRTPNKWVVSVESRSGSVDGTLGWVPVPGSEVELVSSSRNPLFATNFISSGEIKLPAPRGSQPFRLVIREYEVLEADADPKAGAQRATPKRRLVFAETLEV